jgi:hypothetical protein
MLDNAGRYRGRLDDRSADPSPAPPQRMTDPIAADLVSVGGTIATTRIGKRVALAPAMTSGLRMNEMPIRPPAAEIPSSPKRSSLSS